MKHNRENRWAAPLSASLLAALIAAATPFCAFSQGKGAAPGKADRQTILALGRTLARDPTACAGEAATLLAAETTTNPALRRKVATIAEIVRADKGREGDLSARFEAIYVDPKFDKAILIEMAPRVICRDHANAEGLRVIETLEDLAKAEGAMEWALQYVRSKALIYMAEGDCEKAVAQLEKIRSFKTPKEAGRFSNTITLRKNEKDAFLRKATAEQLDRLAAVYDAWAALLENAKGEALETYATSAQLRADAKQARRTAEIKRAAAQAAK